MSANTYDTCRACGRPLVLWNLFADDGCPCNCPKGTNFTPQPCDICKVDVCVKPGHRLDALFGTGTPRSPVPSASAGRPALAVLAADFEQELCRAERGHEHARHSGHADHEAEARAEVRVWEQALAKLRNVLSGRHPDAPPKPWTIEILEPPPEGWPAPKAADIDAAIQAIISSPTRAMQDRAESWCAEHGVDVSHAADLAEVFQCWAAEYHRRGAHDEAEAQALRARAASKAAPDEPTTLAGVDGLPGGACVPSDPLTARIDALETRLRALEHCPKHPHNQAWAGWGPQFGHVWEPADGSMPRWNGERFEVSAPFACKHCGVPMVPPGVAGLAP